MNRPCQCSLCGSSYSAHIFKGGYICEDCIEYVRSINTVALSDESKSE